MEETFRDDHAYDGEWELCGGGPDKIQKQQEADTAATNKRIAAAADREEAFKEAQQARTNPFYGNLMDNGPEYTPALLDYEGGVNARAYAPEKANLVRTLGSETGLPSGYRDQAITDFNERRASGYDAGLTGILADRQAARERGAAGLMGEAQIADPSALYSNATAGANAIFNAPRRPGFSGTLSSLIKAGTDIGGKFIHQA